MKKHYFFTKIIILSLFILAVFVIPEAGIADVSQCASFNSSANTLHIPCFNLGATSYWLDLGLVNQDLQLNTFGDNGTPGNVSECASFNFSSNVLHIPCLSFAGMNYWVDLVLISSNPVAFDLSDFGLSYSGWLRPAPQTSWEIQFSGTLNTTYNVTIYDLDLINTDSIVVDALHSQGHKVICYISAGSYEDWRPDAADFPSSVLGNDYPGWPGEKFIDIRSSAVRQIMANRLDLCKSKGFDGVDPDNIDVFETTSGFPLTRQDGIDYANWLALQAHNRGLGIGQKNTPDIVNEIQPNFDWALVEDCYGGNPASPWCGQMQPYIANNKAVFMVEYTDTITSAVFKDKACVWGTSVNKFSPILKNRNLDAALITCQ